MLNLTIALSLFVLGAPLRLIHSHGFQEFELPLVPSHFLFFFSFLNALFRSIVAEAAQIETHTSPATPVEIHLNSESPMIRILLFNLNNREAEIRESVVKWLVVCFVFCFFPSSNPQRWEKTITSSTTTAFTFSLTLIIVW